MHFQNLHDNLRSPPIDNGFKSIHKPLQSHFSPGWGQGDSKNYFKLLNTHKGKYLKILARKSSGNKCDIHELSLPIYIDNQLPRYAQIYELLLFVQILEKWELLTVQGLLNIVYYPREFDGS